MWSEPRSPFRVLFAGTLVFLAASVAGPSPAHPPSPPSGEAAPCSCAAAKAHNGWCDSCAVGYVGGVAVPSPAFYEILDPHGHDLDPAAVSCGACRWGLRHDGFCSGHGIGFARGRAYVSRFAYLLARGEEAPESGLCALDPGGGTFWCERCRQGRVGSFTYTDRDLYGQAVRERARLLSSLDRMDACEFCAVASFTGGRCPVCNVSYRDGRPLPVGE